MKKYQEDLNKLVANLAVFYVKLHHYHWLVTGHEFFAIHAKLESLYDYITGLYDTVAERLVQLKEKPATTLKEYLSLATIKEAEGKDAKNLGEVVLKDLVLLKEQVFYILEQSEKEKDIVTSDILTQTLSALEKEIWFFAAYNN